MTIHKRLTKSDDKFPLLKELHHAIVDKCGGTQVDGSPGRNSQTEVEEETVIRLPEASERI